MNNDSENENEKSKEIKKEEEEEGDEDYEDEAGEDAAEGSLLEKAPLSEKNLSSDSCPADAGVSVSGSESEGRSARDSYLERRELILKEKWRSLVGRRPRNVPLVRRIDLDELDQIEFFGDRKPAETDRKRRERWAEMVSRKKYSPNVVNLGQTRNEHRLPALCEGLTCVRFTHDSESLAMSFGNGAVQVTKIADGSTTRLKTIEAADRLPARGVRYHPRESHTLYVGGASGMIQTFDTETGSLLGVSDRIGQLNTIDISSDGNNLVVGAGSGFVYLFDPFTLEVTSERRRPNLTEGTLSTIDDEFHSMRVYAAKFHPKDPNVFVTGSWDHTVKIWDVREPSAILSIRGPFVSGEAVDIKDNIIVSGSWVLENSLTLWDYPSGRKMKTVPLNPGATRYEGEFVYAVRFFDSFTAGGTEDLIAVGGSGFNEVLVIAVKSEKILASFPTYKSVLALDTMNNLVAYGGNESLLRVGEVVSPEKVKAFHGPKAHRR